MSSKRRLRRRSCEGKIRHATLGDAYAHARKLALYRGEYINAYKCPFCGGAHVGRPTKPQAHSTWRAQVLNLVPK